MVERTHDDHSDHDGQGHSPGEHGGSGHGHGVSRDADRRYLIVALVLIVAFMIFEVTVAFTSGSLALLADAGHMLTDAGAIGLSIWAIHLAGRQATDVWTFGFKRVEILSAAINGGTLVVIAALIIFEAIQRLLHPSPVHGAALLVVAGVGVVVNLAATWTLSKANRSSLNIAGAFKHLLTDLYAFIATFLAGIVIIATGFSRADAIASLLVAGLMLHAAWGLLRDSGHILLEGAPPGVDLASVRTHLLETSHVQEVHDLHAWVVTSDLPALSAHVVVQSSCFDDGHAPQILDELQSCLIGHFDVEHSTFQLEPPGHVEHEINRH